MRPPCGAVPLGHVPTGTRSGTFQATLPVRSGPIPTSSLISKSTHAALLGEVKFSHATERELSKDLVLSKLDDGVRLHLNHELRNSARLRLLRVESTKANKKRCFCLSILTNSCKKTNSQLRYDKRNGSSIVSPSYSLSLFCRSKLLHGWFYPRTKNPQLARSGAAFLLQLCTSDCYTRRV